MRGRPRNESTPYIMKVHTTRGHAYVSTRRRIEGKNTMGYIHWGTLEDGKFIPNPGFLLLPRAEQDKYVFDKDWDLSSYHKMRDETPYKAPSGTELKGRSLSMLYGHIWLLEQVVKRQGVEEDLLKTFNGDKEKVKELISVAFYIIAYPEAFYNMSDYQRICRFPTSHAMSSTAISRLAVSITYDDLVRFSKLRIERFRAEGTYAIDSSSISSYSEYRTSVLWGRNKKKEPLRQSNLLVAYSIKTHQPVFVMELPGNMPDGRNFFDILTTFKDLGILLAVLVTDRGYFSTAILEELIKADAKAIMAVKTGGGDAYTGIKEVKFDVDGQTPLEFDLSTKLEMYTKQIEIPYKIRLKDGTEKAADRLKLNLYFNPYQRAERKFDRKLEIKREEENLDKVMEEGRKITKDEKPAFNAEHPHLDIVYEDDGAVKGYSLRKKRNAVSDFTDGFRANMTLGIDETPEDAMLEYAERDVQEKMFEMLGILGLDRFGTHGDETTQGKLFFYFIALILYSDLRECWKALSAKEKKKFPSTRSFILAMQSIRYIQTSDGKSLTTQFIGKQVDVCRYCNVEIPAECAPDKQSQRIIEKRKRGRPRKTTGN